MSTYPVYYSGLRLTAALLTAGQPDRTLKTLATAKVNNTYADDPELSGVALGVGTWHVYMLIYANNAAATGDIKTTWTFSGTWSTPLRLGIGPGPTNTGLADAITPAKSRPFLATQDSVYGLGASGAYTGIQEIGSAVVVTAAGDLALTWAQNTTDAGNATNVQAGSYIEVRQIA